MSPKPSYSYGVQKPSYGAPKPSYGAPKPSYGSVSPSYRPANSGNNAPMMHHDDMMVSHNVMMDSGHTHMMESEHGHVLMPQDISINSYGSPVAPLYTASSPALESYGSPATPMSSGPSSSISIDSYESPSALVFNAPNPTFYNERTSATSPPTSQQTYLLSSSSFEPDNLPHSNGLDIYGSPVSSRDSYGSPAADVISSTKSENSLPIHVTSGQESNQNQDIFSGTLTQETYSAPIQEAYGGALDQDGYNAPKAQSQEGYGSLGMEVYSAPSQESYGALQAIIQPMYTPPIAESYKKPSVGYLSAYVASSNMDFKKFIAQSKK